MDEKRDWSGFREFLRTKLEGNDTENRRLGETAAFLETAMSLNHYLGESSSEQREKFNMPHPFSHGATLPSHTSYNQVLDELRFLRADSTRIRTLLACTDDELDAALKQLNRDETLFLGGVA